MMRTIEILVSDVFSFRKEVKRLNKKANRLQLPEITLRDMGKENVTQTRLVVIQHDNAMGERFEEEKYRTVPIEVTRFEMHVPDLEEYRWELIGSITPTDEGIPFVDIHKYRDEINPEDYTDATHCDHCKTKRIRNLTYLVRHKDDHHIEQVGRNCLKDYVGHEGLLKLEFQDLLVSVFGIGDDDFIFPESYGQRKMEVVDVRTVIATAELIAEVDSWRNNAYWDNPYTGFREVASPGTHRIAASIVKGEYKSEKMLDWKWISLDALNRIRSLTSEDPIWKKVDEIISEIQDLEVPEDNDFLANLSYCSQFKSIPSKKASLIGYAGQFLRNKKEREEREAKKAQMKFLGTVGERTIFENLTCTRINSFDTDYGVSYLHTFEDSEGNVLIWFTNQEQFKEGQTGINLKARIKEHKYYRDAPQTVLTRASEATEKDLKKFHKDLAKQAQSAVS